MKKTNLLQISIIPLIVMVGLVLTVQPPQKGKDKNQKEHRGQDHPGKKSDDKRGNGKADRDWGSDGNNGHGKGRGQDHGNDKVFKGKPEKYKGKSIAAYRNEKPGKNNKPSRDVIRGWDWANGGVVWGINDYPNRKRPKDFKKVTICHQTGNNGYPVTINVSENALQAHLNHGDEIGDCNIDYSSWWTPRYVRSRENIYNVYEQTWENMSYSESLLEYALRRLLGARNDLERNRAYYTPAQIERRQLIIRDLETNTGLLQSQLGVTRQRLNGLNITVQL